MYPNISLLEEAKNLVKYFYRMKGQVEYKANEEKFKVYAVVGSIIRKGCIQAGNGITFGNSIESRKYNYNETASLDLEKEMKDLLDSSSSEGDLSTDLES